MKKYFVDRRTTIKHFTDIDMFNSSSEINELYLNPSANENYVIQIAVVPQNEHEITEIVCEGNDKMYCINTDIVDKWGNKFKKAVKLVNDNIQPLFFIIPANKENANKNQEVSIKIITDTGIDKISVHLSYSDKPVENEGCDDLKSLARLDWLNSTKFLNNEVVKPYTEPIIDGDKIRILGRDIEIGHTGLPNQVYYYFDEGINLKDSVENKLFLNPMKFNVGNDEIKYHKKEFKQDKGYVYIETVGENDTADVKVNGKLTFEGAAFYEIQIKAKEDRKVSNIGLVAEITPECSTYMNGLGAVGGFSKSLEFKWSEQYHRDCLYVGTVNAGMRIKWKAENYVKPLVNIYYHNLPLKVPEKTWDNYGKGRVIFNKNTDIAEIRAETNEFTLKKGKTYTFAFELHFVPFRPVDYKKHYATRYFHNNAIKNEIEDVDEAAIKKLTHMIIHHGNMVHPFINYPFIEVERLKNLVDYAKKANIGVKVYYTVREHSNHMAEVFVYKALGDEIIYRHKGQGFNWGCGEDRWLREYFGDTIIPAWRVKYDSGKYKGDNDVSFIVRPNSRLDNYYIEGLNYLVKNIGIKGIYIDDTALDRTTVLRARKVINQNDGLIDMHMWNHENDRAGNVSCMNLYTEIFPFIDSLWIGEGYQYEKLSPEYILTEISGLPYGQTSQMLQNGGNPYIGMLYAMNNRYGWGVRNADKIYALWDEFHIESSTMTGYWHSKNPVHCNDSGVKITTYINNDSALVCMFNFNEYTANIKLEIDKKLMGSEPVNEYEYIIDSGKKKLINTQNPICLNAKDGKILWLCTK